MKKVILFACVIGVISLSGCSEQPEYDNSLPRFPAASTPSAVSADTSKPAVSETVNNPISITNQQPLPSMPEQFTSAKGSAALNPKHGAPGHRCDIAVGAPLNSPAPPVQQSAPSNQTLPAPVKALTNPAGTIKLNPAHGEPGHDCAIAVGKPLKS